MCSRCACGCEVTEARKNSERLTEFAVAVLSVFALGCIGGDRPAMADSTEVETAIDDTGPTQVEPTAEVTIPDDTATDTAGPEIVAEVGPVEVIVDGADDSVDTAPVDSDVVCDPSCNNGGVCLADSGCDCRGTGFEGATCAVPVCTGGCLNGGVCVYPESCECRDQGFGGPNCADPICTRGCVFGTCTGPERCGCEDGYVGERCETPVCLGGCLNGGVCSAPDTCDCDGTMHSGAHCELIECSLRPCPALVGFDVICSAFARCEYTRSAPTEAWHEDDVWIHMRSNSFPMGSPDGEWVDNSVERPQHVVTLAKAFMIARYEVTVRIYDACVATGQCSPAEVRDFGVAGWGLNTAAGQRSRHPQNGLSWAQARSVCTFLGGRLPSEAEWEYAADGSSSHRLYPWGNSPDPSCGVHAVFDDGGPGCGSGGTMEVGPTLRVAGQSGVGAQDMAGNVWEWVEDCWHSNYVGAPQDGGAWTADCGSTSKVVRGASYLDREVGWMRTAYRTSSTPTFRDAFAGVRCARDAPTIP